ncbi:lymphocyte antigen 6D [Syngnathus acus]|uniref:lymphocyte antigen 6D n=1 Tax=Syngnathus acus TaxID=161584 RepID=UPI001885E527|nr:lymphocyte antigen 6D [Syngnathus acus]
MKVMLFTTLLLLLCSTQVLTLRCFSYSCGDGNMCDNWVNCEENQIFCKTVGSGNQLTKSCAAECKEDFETSCCQSDLC